VTLGHQTFIFCFDLASQIHVFFCFGWRGKGGEVANGRTPFGFIASKSGNSQSHLEKKKHKTL
jgi:hypothetical protein